MTSLIHRDLELSEKCLKNDGDGIDYISSMPDEILCEILSYFDMKFVIRTRILSTRWKKLSPFNVPPIKLYLDQCFNQDCNCYEEHYSRSFIAFVDTLLYETLHDGPSVESMLLSWCGYCTDGHHGYEMYKKIDKENVDMFVGWVNAVLRLNVKDLTLVFLNTLESSFTRRGFTDIIHSLNGCVTLVELNLKGRGEDGRIDLRVPGEFILPNLKSLYLYSFAVDVSINSLIGGCPMLNELFFSGIVFPNKLYIESQVLEIFVLVSCCFEGEVVFDAPNIEALVCNFLDDIPDWVGADFKNLHSAYIELDFIFRDDLYLSKLAKIVKSCSSATRLCLHLGRDPIMDLFTEKVQVSVFRNLTWLGIMRMGENEFEALARFLNNVPTIQTLKLSIHGDTLGCYARFESLLPTIPICLRKIEILNFEGEEDVVKLVEYFLNNGTGMQKVTLHHHHCQRSIQKRLLAFPKLSETAQIIIKEYNEEKYGDKLLEQCLSSYSSDKLFNIAKGYM